MKTIKFRGKRIDDGTWVYGSYHYSRDNKHHYILIQEKFVEIENMQCLHKPEVHMVILETVGRYIGLYDGFQNPIYEGDAVETLQVPKGIVKWNQEYCGFWINFTDSEGKKRYSNFRVTYGDGDIYICESAEVIGNIHDNPELINQ